MAKELKDMTVAEANASGQGQAYSNLVAGHGQGTPNTLPKPTTNTITSNQLTPVTPAVLPPTPTTDNSNIQSNINNFSAANATDAEIAALKLKSNTETKKISDLMSDIGTTTGKQDQYFTDAGGYDAKKQYDEFASQLEQEQLRSQRAQDAAKLNPEGKSTRALQQEMADIESKSLSKQADIAILGNAASRRYDTALTIAKNKVEAELAPKKAELEGLKFIQENNKGFQTAEFSALLSKKNNEYEKEKATLTTIENIKIEAAKNGLKDFSAFSDIKTVDDALKAAGGYLTSPSTSITKLDNGNTVVVDTRTGKIISNLGGSKPSDTTDVPSNFSALVKTVSALENTVAGKESVRNDMSTYIKNQDYVGAYNQIANTVAQGLPAGIKERFENARVDREVLSTFKDALKDYEAGGGDLGLLTGTAENIKRKLLGVTGDAAQTALAVQLEREFQAYRQAMTGAAFTPQESKEYAAVNPTATKNFDLNYAVIDGAIAQLNNRVDGTIKAKVPQAVDILNLTKIPQTAAEADKEIERIYLSADDETASIIDKLSAGGEYGSMDILQYLKDKGITK